MKILYIGGTKKTIDENGNHLPFEKSLEKEFILQKFGDTVIYPEIFWDRGNYLASYLSHVIESQKINAVVGYSAGGYLGFYLCNKYKIPGLHFNPAIANNCLAPRLQPIDYKMKISPLFREQIMVLGEKDTKDSGGVDYPLVVEFLEDIKFREKGGEIFIEPIEHRINDEILERYFTYFHAKYVK
jgi:hypothetical protein